MSPWEWPTYKKMMRPTIGHRRISRDQRAFEDVGRFDLRTWLMATISRTRTRTLTSELEYAPGRSNGDMIGY